MKKIILALLIVGAMLAPAKAVEITAGLPNVEASTLYDATESRIVAGVTSKLLSYGDFDFRLGCTETGKWLTSLSYDLRNLEKLGPELNYAWGNSSGLSIGSWIGYDFTARQLSWGFLAVLIQVNF